VGDGRKTVPCLGGRDRLLPLNVMRRLTSLWSLPLVALLAPGAVVAAGEALQKSPGPVPTFNKEVAPILYARCITCHRPGEIGPMSLLSYEDAVPWARAIKVRVLAREMPPWPADPRYGKFRNEHRLTDAQIATLVGWIDGGAPRGDGNPPKLPKFREGWTSLIDRPPDEIIEWSADFEIAANGEMPAFSVWSRLPIHEERFLEAVELRPANRAIVHHANVFAARLPQGARLGRGEAWPGGPVVDGIPLARDGTVAPLSPLIASFAKPLVFYVPGGGVLRLPRGIGKRVTPDDHLMWSFHFIGTDKVERPSVRIGLWFSRDDVHHEAVTLTVTDKIFVNGVEVPRDPNGLPRFPSIAPHDAEFVIAGVTEVTEDLTLYSLWPHMHSRGREMTFTVTDRKGVEQTLLSVPKYSFDWQFAYELASPLKIRAGSTIKAVARYDNSAANRANPDPNQEVIFGQAAANEMFNPFLELTFDRRVISRPDCNQGQRPFDPANPGAGGGGLPPPGCR
jgi:hypothetical protein